MQYLMANSNLEIENIDFIVHGTMGLNAFLERKGSRTLLMTKGISDTYVARGDEKNYIM